MNSQNNKKRNQIVESLELPKDILLGLPLLSLTGNLELAVENHRGLLVYNSNEISIRTKSMRINMTGKNLSVYEYGKDLLVIRGRINHIWFVT